MVNGLLKRFSRSDYWKFMSWYRERFGFFPALSSYLKLWINRIGTAPNPLNGIAVKLRPATTDLHVYDEIFLARKEVDLLSLLASKTGRVFPRAEILNKVWGEDIIVGDRTIDVHIRKIRQKVGDETIKTVKGVGYKFET